MTGRYQARLAVGLEEPISPLSPKGMRAVDPGCAKTPEDRTQMGIVFPGPIEFERSCEQ